MYTQARLWILLAGVAVLLGRSESLRGSALVAELKAKAKAALLNPTETVEEVVTVETDASGNATSPTNVTVTKPKSLLTGNPQKDYIYDPNLPRELNGYNLSSYPFLNGVPEDIDFKCDDLHDGFYASVPHKCQVYHHCLFGTRYDFLCANYTAFDQRTFICHFVSEVDCDNSPKFFQRNEALYKAASTSPPIVITTTTTTTTTPAPTPAAQRPRRRRPYRRRRPVYEYYYDDQYDDEEYYDDDPPPPRRKSNRKHRPQGAHNDDEDDYYDSGRRESSRSDGSRSSGSSRSDNSRGDGGEETSKETKPTVRISGPAAGTVYDRPRVAPKIRRPVPIHERDKYDYTAKSTNVSPAPTDGPKKVNKPQNKHEEEDEEYYDYEYEDDYVKPPLKRGKGGSETSSDSNEKSNSRRPSGRNRPRQPSRRRPERYDDEYEDDRPVRARKRQRHEETPQMGKGNRGGYRGYSREEPDPVPAERPGFISTSRFSSSSRKRNEDDRSQSSSKRNEDDRAQSSSKRNEDDRAQSSNKRNEDDRSQSNSKRNEDDRSQSNSKRNEDDRSQSNSKRNEDDRSQSNSKRNEDDRSQSNSKRNEDDRSQSSSKRNEDNRSQSSSKKTYSTPVYDDEEEEEEYYDDEEGEVKDDEVNRRVHRPSDDSNNGRHTEDYDSDSGRKSNRKQTENSNSSKLSSKSNINSPPSAKNQEDSAKYDNKSSKRQKPDSSSFSRDNLDSSCKRRSCEADYSDYSTESSSEEKLKRIDTQTLNTEKDTQNSASERERLFSSRFRDSQNESKSKQQTSDPTGPGRPPAYQNLRGTTEKPEFQQRFKPTSRGNPNSDEYLPREQSTPTNVAALSSDSSDETVTNKYPNFRSKGRIVPPTPLLDNYKPVQTTDQPPEIISNNQEPERELNSDSSFDSNSDRSVSTRPFSGVPRRPVKPVTETMPLDEEPASQKSSFVGFNYRHAHPINEDNDKSARNQGNSAQNYRRVKVDPSQFETRDDNQPKQSNIGNNFRRPNKPLEEIKPEVVSYLKGAKEDLAQPEENTKVEDKPSLTDKIQSGGPSYGGTYRRLKVSAIPSPGPESESSTTENDAPQSLQGTQALNPVNNYKRPFLVTRPLSNYPVVVEDTTKNSLSINGPLRRPVKQKISGGDVPSPLDDYNPPSATGIGESYHKVEPSSGINVRPGLGYFLPKRAKVRIEENSQRDLEQYPKQLTLNQEEQFSKQSPKVEITAPGPSAPDTDIATVKSHYRNDYNSGPPGFTLDIPEEEYDVTLNDALQPSTLHPTRSLVDYQQTRLKTRDYQTNVGRTPEYRGRVSYLLPAASQQYVSRVQSVFATEKQEENPITARYTNDKGNKKAVSLDQEEYEAVVLTAPADQWPNQRRNQPTEWYW